jgi:hypothetical protein
MDEASCSRNRSGPPRGAQRPDDARLAVDGMKGLPDAIEAGFPRSQVQPCIVYLVCGFLRYSVLEGTQGRGQGPDGDLPGADPRSPGGVRRALGQPVPADQSHVAHALG